MDSPPRSDSPPISDIAVAERTLLSERFRTQYCRSLENGKPCKMGFKCMFAHSEAEKRTVEMNVRDELFTQDDIDSFKRKLLPLPAHTRTGSMPSPHGLTDPSGYTNQTGTDRGHTPHSQTHNTTYTVDTNLSGTSPAGGSSMNNISSRSLSEEARPTPSLDANSNAQNKRRRNNKHTKPKDVSPTVNPSHGKSFSSAGSRSGQLVNSFNLPIGTSPFVPPTLLGCVDKTFSQSCSPRTLVGIHEFATPRNQMGHYSHARVQSQGAVSITSGTSSGTPLMSTPHGHIRYMSNSVSGGGMKLGAPLEQVAAPMPVANAYRVPHLTKSLDRISMAHSRHSTMDSFSEEAHLNANFMRDPAQRGTAVHPVMQPAPSGFNSGRNHRTPSDTARHAHERYVSQGSYYHDPNNFSITQNEEGRPALFQIATPTSVPSPTPRGAGGSLTVRVGVPPQLNSSLSSPMVGSPGRSFTVRVGALVSSPPCSPVVDTNTVQPPSALSPTTSISTNYKQQESQNMSTSSARAASPTNRFRREPYCNTNPIRFVQSLGSMSEIPAEALGTN